MYPKTNSNSILQEFLTQKEYEQNYFEITNHLQNLYYIKYDNDHAEVVDNLDSYPSGSFYKIDKTHEHICSFILNLQLYSSQISTLFSKYFECILLNDGVNSTGVYSDLISTLKSLHVFFQSSSNATTYIQSEIINYVKCSIPYYVNHFRENNVMDISELANNLRTVFQSLIAPTLPKNNSGNSQWTVFLHSLTSKIYPRLEDILALCIKEPLHNDCGSLLNLEYTPCTELNKLQDLLSYYVFTFSDLIYSNKDIPASSFFCYFCTLPKYHHFFQLLANHKLLTDPLAIYSIIMNSIKKENFPSLDIYIEDELFANYTDSFFERLEDLTLSSSERKRIKNGLADYFSSKYDLLLSSEIHVFHTFEELIYFEVFNLLKSLVMIRKCAAQNCNNYFVTANRHHKYCKICSNNVTTADKTYRNKMSPIVKEKKKIYNKKYYQINSRLPSNEINKAKTQLKLWNNEVNKVIHELKTQNITDDIELFHKKLREKGLE